MVASAMAISSWRCSPWLRLETITSARAASPTRASAARAGVAQLSFPAGVAPEAKRVTGMGLHGERHVVERGEIEEQGGDLERAGEAKLTAAIDRAAR